MKLYKFLSIFILLLPFASCSTKQNTAQSRFWQAFSTRFNTFFNAQEAYNEGISEQYKQGEDDFTKILPFFIISNDQNAKIGTSNFSRSIEKCQKAIQLHSIKTLPKRQIGKKISTKERNFLSRKEFNPYLYKAWLLMGKAQFHKADYTSAIATFSYVSRLYKSQPEISNEALMWLSRSFSALGWYYDAEQALKSIDYDSISKSLKGEWNATQANLLISQKRYEEAIPYLIYSASNSKPKIQQARLHFLAAQIYKFLGKKELAFEETKRCLKKSPPYEMALNAKILQTEVLSYSTSHNKSIKKLSKMLHNDKNKDYFDLINYAKGNIYLAEKDTLSAITSYEEGRLKSTTNGFGKASLLLTLAELYWDKHLYNKAQSAYNEALSIIDSHNENYNLVFKRSQVLDELIPYTNIIHREDSLQTLSLLSETKRLEIIDQAISEYKKTEKQKQKTRFDSLSNTRSTDSNNRQQNINFSHNDNSKWYFYNSQLVNKGKQDFKKIWGFRKDEDNWRRSNKTILASLSNTSIDYAKLDSIKAVQDSINNSFEHVSTDPSNDPLKREYYLKNIPFSKAQKQHSDSLIADALYHAGIIEKNELEDIDLAINTLTRLVTQYKTSNYLFDAYSELFLLYAQKGNKIKSEYIKNELNKNFADKPFTKQISSPDYDYYAKFGKAIEDSLYQATYQSFIDNNFLSIKKNYNKSSQLFPNGANRDKFIFLYILSQIGSSSSNEINQQLLQLVESYPHSEVAKLSSYIIKGIKEGRDLFAHNSQINMKLWDKRKLSKQTNNPKENTDTLSKVKNTSFTFVIVFPENHLFSNKLLYALAHFNFSGFYIRSFEIEKITTKIKRDNNSDSTYTTFCLHGFKNFEEVYQYVQEVYSSASLTRLLANTKTYLISETNFKLIPSIYSFETYEKFYKTYIYNNNIPKLSIDFILDPSSIKYEDTPTTIYPRQENGAKISNPLVPFKMKDRMKDKTKDNKPIKKENKESDNNLYPL